MVKVNRTARGISAADRVSPVGESLEFGLATFGRALSHFPYALLGVQEMGRGGWHKWWASHVQASTFG